MKKQILIIYLIFFMNLFLINIISSQEIVGDISVSVIVTPAEWTCILENNELVWKQASTGISEPISQNCYKIIDSANGIGQGCCGSNKICQPRDSPIQFDSELDPIYICAETIKDRCSSFHGTSINECNIEANTDQGGNSNSNPKINTLEQNFAEPLCGSSYIIGDCLEQISCNCTWEAATSKCLAVKTTTKTCPPILTDKIQVNCKIEVTSYVDSCADDGFIHITFNKILDPPTADPNEYNCLPTDSKDISCEQVARMGFFSIFNIISVLALLIIFYVYQIGKEKKK